MARRAPRGGRAVRASRAVRRVRGLPDAARVRAAGLTTTKYDDVDFHTDAVVQAGLPEENAFAHIGLYLGWLIRRDLVNPEMFVDDHVAPVKSGEMTGSDLAGAVDGKLVSDMLTDEGAAFTDWYYERYVAEYTDAFPGRGDYEIPDDEESAAVVSALLDRRLDEWRTAGRPDPPQASRFPFNLGDYAGMTGEQFAEMWRAAAPEQRLGPRSVDGVWNQAIEEAADGDRKVAADLQALFKKIGGAGAESPRVTNGITKPPSGSVDPETDRLLAETLSHVFTGATFVEVEPPAPPHEAPELEALFPRDLVPGGVQISSTSASRWRDSVLNKVLKQLGVEPADAIVANAIAGRGEGMLTMQITSFPGIDRATLWSLIPRLEKVSGGRCDVRQVADRRVRWCTYAEFGVKATWATDGLVVWASARDARLVEAAIARLP